MRTYLKRDESIHLFVMFVVELKDVLHEGLIITGESLSIVFEIQNCPRLRLDLADVEVDDASDFKATLCFLDAELLLLLLHLKFGLLARITNPIGSAVAIVTAVVVPEIFKIFAL